MNNVLANQIYWTLCDALDERGWSYEKEEDKLLVHFGVSGNDIPMQILILVDADRQLIRVMAPIGFRMKEDKLLDGAIACTVASYGMVDGNFDYDVSDGSIVYRLTASYRGSKIGKGLFHYLIDCTCVTVDDYNEKFFGLNTGTLTLQDFIEQA